MKNKRAASKGCSFVIYKHQVNFGAARNISTTVRREGLG